MALPDTFDKLKELLTQDQFELLLDEEKKEEKQKIRLVYLMNDAVESFLVFHEARLTGEYRKEYEGELVSSLSEKEKDEIPGPRYVLVVHQGETVVTVFFEALSLEVNCYDYGEVGHFWMKGWEYLRLLEYRLAILRDKRDYLGESFCSREEVALSELTAFPPLNYCCYPSVSQEYIVPREEPWTPNKDALAVMEGMAEKVGDRSFLFWLGIYRRFSFCFLARFLANRLHKNAHAPLVDLLAERLKAAAALYPRRSFPEMEGRLALAEKRRQFLEDQGIHADIIREEPFTTARDSIEGKVYVMRWKKSGTSRKVVVEEIKEN